MRWLALLVGLWILAFALFGFVSPDALLSAVGVIFTPLGLYVAAAVRVAFGIVLLLAARSSRAPGVLRVLGFIMFVAGVLTPLFGVDRARAMLAWWSAAGPAFIRLWTAVGIALGAFIVYATAPRREA